MKNEIEKIVAEYTDGKETLQEAILKSLRLLSVVRQSEQLAVSALQKIEKVHSESHSAQVARNALKEIANVHQKI